MSILFCFSVPTQAPVGKKQSIIYLYIWKLCRKKRVNKYLNIVLVCKFDFNIANAIRFDIFF